MDGSPGLLFWNALLVCSVGLLSWVALALLLLPVWGPALESFSSLFVIILFYGFKLLLKHFLILGTFFPEQAWPEGVLADLTG